MDIGNINNKPLDTINTFMNTTAQAADAAAGDGFEARLKNAMEKKDDKELKKVCQQFESIMLGMVYKQMKATIPKSDFLKEDASIETFQSMFDDELVDEASKRSSLGIGDVIYKQLSKQIK